MQLILPQHHQHHITKQALLLSASVVLGVSLLVLGAVYVIQNSYDPSKNSDYNLPTSASMPAAAYTETGTPVMAYDYDYDVNTGKLRSMKDNKVIYTFPEGKKTLDNPSGRPSIYIFSFLDGSKLIFWQTNSST